MSRTNIYLLLVATGISTCAFASHHSMDIKDENPAGMEPIVDEFCPQDEKLTLFYQTINQNSPISYANNHLCVNNMLSFSGRISMDFRFYERYGAPFLFNVWGVGLRPMFGSAQGQFWASLNEDSLFVDARINNWMMADLSLAYVNGSVKGRTFDNLQSDWRSVYGSEAGLKVDEAYLVFARPEQFPFYVRIGKQYSIFGNYKPYPITESLPQLLEQSRTGAFVAGAVLPNGLYGSISWSLSKQSIADINGPAGNETSALNGPSDHLDRNYGAKIGYQINTQLACQDFHFNANVSWIDVIGDVDYLNELWFFANASAENPLTNIFTAGQEGFMKNKGGAAAHVDVQWGPFGAGADYVTALGDLNPVPDTPSRVYAWGVDVSYTFPLPIAMFEQCCMMSTFDLSYQGSGNGNVFGTIIFNQAAFDAAKAALGPLAVLLPIRFGNILPERRWVGTYTVGVMKNVSVSAQWVHDIDFSTSHSFGEGIFGSGRSSNIGVLNVTAQF